MKKNIKKFSASILLSIAVLSGCGGSEDSSNNSNTLSPIESNYIEINTAEELVDHAITTMDSLESISSFLDVEINMSMMGQEMLTQTVTTAHNFFNPTKLHLSMDIITSDGTQSVEMYVDQEDSKINTYLLSTDDQWIFEEILADDLISLLAHKQATDVLPTLQNPSISSETTDDNGITKYSVTGYLDTQSMMNVAIANGTFATAQMLGMTIEDLENIVYSMDNLEVNFIIGSNGLVYEYSVDMYPMLQGLMDTAMEKTFGMPVAEMTEIDMGIIVDKALVKISTSNFNNVEDFNIPAAAKNSQ